MNVKEIDQILREDEEKAEKFKQALESAKENGAKSDAEAMSMAAAAAGIQITPEQVEQSVAKSQEVTDEDLELVAGGKEDDWCAISYNCYLAFLHESEQNKTAACYYDYLCIDAWKGADHHEF